MADIAWHLSQGLYITVMQKPELVKQPEIPEVIAQSCDGQSSPPLRN